MKTSKSAADIRSFELESQGHRLRVVTQAVGAGEWELWVENERGGRSVWLELFSNPEAAFTAGIEAIECEGPDEFIGGVDYEPLAEAISDALDGSRSERAAGLAKSP